MIPRVKNYVPRSSVLITGPECALAPSVHALRSNATGTIYVHFAGDAADVWRTVYMLVGETLVGEIDRVRIGTLTEGDLIGLLYPEA